MQRGPVPDDRVGHELSVVVPTRNESGNIEELLHRIRLATEGLDVEVVFVDDSTDNTPEVIAELSHQCGIPVSLIHRPAERRVDGLGGAVVEGIRAASGKWIVVMDGDLQHPPEDIPRLVDCADQKNADLVIASRFAADDAVEGLSSSRLVISKLTGAAARLLFPRRLASVSDPLTGFFALRRAAIDPDRLRPRGFKILLEILVRHPSLTVAEIPFRFGHRVAGESKAGIREAIRYVMLLCELRVGQKLSDLFRFGLVGLTGLAVNQLVLAVLTGMAGIHYAASAAIATQCSTLWNYILTDRWVFRHRPRGGRVIVPPIAKFFAVNNVMLLAREPFLVLLTSGLAIHYLLSNLITIFGSTLLRFVVADGWIWPTAAAKATRKTFRYDIHGIVRIESEGILPELEEFRVSAPLERPDLRVTVGGYWSRFGPGRRHSEDGDRRFRYQEALGPFGFWVDITRGDCTDVVVGPLLRWSPHVLYTNVVEPILRWMMVERGMVLVHGACAGLNGRAVFITARTDTGKTSTLLRLLAHEAIPFLSDDMVIMSADGRVLSYPKPLTISFHTLRTIDGLGNLSFAERLALQLQSRVHSKSGRLMALLLTHLPLPAATINAIVQIIVPPPKYSIRRLIPNVVVTDEAVVRRRVEIERGPNHTEILDADQALSTLLRNCDDAYGFPPYQALEPFLARRNGEDLRQVERAIIGVALRNCETTLIRSQNRDWWRAVSAIIHAAAEDAPVPVLAENRIGEPTLDDVSEAPSREEVSSEVIPVSMAGDLAWD